MGFIENQVGLAQQAVKANLYDQEKQAKDLQAMAQLFRAQGAQEVINRLPELYTQNDVKDSAFNRYNYGADYRPQTPVQIPAGATTGGARLQPEPTPASSVVADYLAHKEAWRQEQNKGK